MMHNWITSDGVNYWLSKYCELTDKKKSTKVSLSRKKNKFHDCVTKSLTGSCGHTKFFSPFFISEIEPFRFLIPNLMPMNASWDERAKAGRRRPKTPQREIRKCLNEEMEIYAAKWNAADTGRVLFSLFIDLSSSRHIWVGCSFPKHGFTAPFFPVAWSEVHARVNRIRR